ECRDQAETQFSGAARLRGLLENLVHQLVSGARHSSLHVVQQRAVQFGAGAGQQPNQRCEKDECGKQRQKEVIAQLGGTTEDVVVIGRPSYSLCEFHQRQSAQLPRRGSLIGTCGPANDPGPRLLRVHGPLRSYAILLRHAVAGLRLLFAAKPSRSKGAAGPWLRLLAVASVPLLLRIAIGSSA